MSSIKIVHFPKKCIGCHSCVAIAPQNWKINEKTGKAELIGGHKKGDLVVAEAFECDLELNRAAADACPMNAIQING